MAKTCPSTRTSSKPARRRSAASVRGSAGWARCSSQALSARCIRSGSAECHESVVQSTSHRTTRPRGRSARWISARTAGRSATYSSTCTERAASKSSPSTGQRGRVGLVKGDVRVRLRAVRGDGEHRRADVDADDRAFGPDRFQELGDVEARPAADIEDPLAGLRGRAPRVRAGAGGGCRGCGRRPRAARPGPRRTRAGPRRPRGGCAGGRTCASCRCRSRPSPPCSRSASPRGARRPSAISLRPGP